MNHEEYKRTALEPIVNYIESVMASYSKEELEARIKKALPELKESKESEDERIRKMLIEQMERWKKAAEDNNVEQDVKDASAAIAYPEKQKEVKWSPSECEMGVLYKLCYVSNQITDEDDTELTRLYQDLKREYFNGHSFENMFSREKQKEPKLESCDCSRDEESYTNGIHHVLMNPEAYGLIKQKPAAWSDSVAKEMFIKALERAVEQTKKGYELTDCDKHSWWEDFKAYSGIKPADWSEEDKHCIHQLILFCENCMQQDSEAIRCATWLKSLRPQLIQDKFDSAMHVADKFEEGYIAGVYDTKAKSWKPSEEQISALEYFIRSWGESGTMSPQNPTLCAAKTLLNDLKSL